MVSIRVVTFPRDDADFARTVADAFQELDRPADSGVEKVVNVVQALLPSYPHVVIRHQDGLASLERDLNTWYVFRDGTH